MNHRANSNGQVLVTFLFLSSLLIGALISLSASGLYLKDKTIALSICRSELISLQKDMKTSMSILTKLNPLALALRLKSKKTKLLLAKATLLGEVPNIMLLTAALKKIKAQQQALAKKQKLILNQAHINSIVKLKLIKHKMYDFVDNLDIPYSKKLALKKKPKNSITPSYVTGDNFSKSQKIKAVWTQSPIKSTPDFIKNKFKNLLVIQDTCTATLKQKGRVWESVLI